MVVEKAFGILMGRWRILMKKIDMPLRFTSDLVTACIMHRDTFDMEWAKNSQMQVGKECTSNIWKHGCN